MKWMFRPLNKKITNMKKILHTIYTSLLLAGLVAFTLTSCADDELVKSGEVVEGVPITVTLNLGGIPITDVMVETRASGSDYSTLYDLVIFIFHENGTFENAVTNYHDENSLTVNSDKIVTDGSDEKIKHHLYNVTFNTTSGTKKLLAVANVAEGSYWKKVIDLLTVAYLNKSSFDEIKSQIVSLREDLTDGVQPFHITASSQMFISGWNEGVSFRTDGSVGNYGKYGDQTNAVVVKMNRAMANITFNIAAKPDGAKGTFTPTSYRVYNIPTKSYLINDLQQEGDNPSYLLTTNVKEVTYIHTASENIGTAQGDNYTFDFYMPENVQKQGTSTTYNAREKWAGDSGASPENKKWTNAPQYSTFVVISGTYEGNATIEDNPEQSVTANVEYTIHLGDFGKSGDTNRNFRDFSVLRNNSYTYNVKVLGVDNIVVEALQKEDPYQNGAEGSIYDNAHTLYSYNLDAHYEQVYLEYNLSDITNSLGQGLSGEELDNAIANQLILIIQSEAMDYTHDYSNDEPYTTKSKRGTLSPYQIYADAVRGKSGQETEEAAKAVKANVLGGDKDVNGNPTKGFDYKWIEFLPQTGTDISAYPGISTWAMEDLDGDETDRNSMNNKSYYADAQGTSGVNGDPTKLIDVYDMIVEMGKAIREIYMCKYSTPPTTPTFTDSKIEVTQNSNSTDYVAHFTAFVNEYYYLRHPLTGAKITSWSKVTNKIPREMIIAMSTKTSTDGNSSYSKIHSYISQLSMQTFYNDKALSLNAFGIETYNETPLNSKFKFGTPQSQSGLSDSDGRENQKVLINLYYWVKPDGSSPNWLPLDWSKYINSKYNGWTSSVGTDRSSHKLTEKAYADEIKAAYSACMSRNRDLNGNGKIDENEIRWFLPSLNEYIRMGIGANAISNAAKLYSGDKTTMTKSNYPSAYISDGSLFYTSSASDKRVYWAIEKGSYGAVGSYYDESKALPIRCIRNLPASGEGVSTDISSVNGVKSDATFKIHAASEDIPIVLEFKDRLVASLYRERAQGSLGTHNEDNKTNSFYQGIFVANDYIKDKKGNIKGYTLKEIIGNGSIMTNPCSNYNESDYGNWRVPNLVELSAMNAAGLLNDCYDAEYGRAASCTQFSNLKVRYGFARSTLIYCPGANGTELDSNFRIRCVRDVPANYTFPTN